MMYRDATITATRRRWGASGRGCVEYDAVVDAVPPGATVISAGASVRAIAYEQLGTVPEVGDRVRLEVSALARGLGTGGHATVITVLDHLPADSPSGGHLVKARYMPNQVMVTGVDEQDTPHHDLLSAPVGQLSLEGAPVIVADLHSALPAVLAGLRSPSPGGTSGSPGPAGLTSGAGRVAYVMTDGGALPLAYSRTVAALSEAGWLAGTITCGQAWGGDLEAVTTDNALLAARHVLHADVIVVIQGPGNLGTDTPWGFSGLGVAEVLAAAARQGGRPVACLRVSQADPRPRHRGISHHSTTALRHAATAPADVVVPDLSDHGRAPGLIDPALAETVLAQARTLSSGPAAVSHRLRTVSVAGLMTALEQTQAATGLSLRTMGRGLADDPAAFLAAAAAGRYVADLMA